ncbi:MAG: HepT-like ribonuclease domain-containing protein [Bryobacteraceae bacterium]
MCPTAPWLNVRAPGNFLRHEYDRVDAARVWLMIKDDLGSLKAAAQRALEHLRGAER